MDLYSVLLAKMTGGGGGGADLPETTNLLKGDGEGGALAAVPGTDYATPEQVNAKYTKPSTGIPASDLASGVQTSLGKADTALQSVPNTYRTASAQDEIDNAQNTAINAKYTKPSGGIPASDLASGVIPAVPTQLSQLTGDTTHRTVTDAQISLFETVSEKQNTFAITPEDYGAVGDGDVDDTDALLQAFSNGSGKTIMLSRTYKLTRPILVGDDTSVLGLSGSIIQTYIDGNVFYSNNENGLHGCRFDGVFVENKYSIQTGNEYFSVFSDLHHCSIIRCKFKGFSIVCGSIKNCSVFAYNTATALKKHFIHSAVDSYIMCNYINASRLGVQESIMVYGNMSNSSFTNNFCDYWGSCFRLESGTKSVVISNNTFDRCRAVFHDLIIQATILGNTFSNIRYVASDWNGINVGRLSTDPWGIFVFDETTVSHATSENTMSLNETVFSGTIGRNVDTYCYASHPIIACHSCDFHGNKIIPKNSSKEKGYLEFLNTKAGLSNGYLQNIFFDFLDGISVDSLTRDTFLGNMTTLVSSSGGLRIFDGLRVSYLGNDYVCSCDLETGACTWVPSKAVEDGSGNVIAQTYESKGKITIGGTEKSVSSHTLSWTEGGITHSYEVVTV